jgi:hypothetical protein
MLVKMDWENLGKIMIIIAVNRNKRDVMERAIRSGLY